MGTIDARFRAAAIDELCQREVISRAEFARRVGASRQLVGAWISGVSEPQFRTVLRLAATFKVSLAFFVEGLELPAECDREAC